MMQKIFPLILTIFFCLQLPAQPPANKAAGLMPFAAGNPKKWGYKNASGNIVITPQYSKALAFIQGFALVNTGGEEDELGFIKGGKWGMINPSGKMVIAARYDMLHPFINGMALFNTGGEYEMIEDIADTVTHSGLGGKWGYLDLSGKEKIPARYDLAFDFSDGLAMVNTGGNAAGCLLGNCGGLFGYIDKGGKEVIALQFQSATGFANGKAGVKKNGREYIIDKKGNEIKHTAAGNIPPPVQQVTGNSASPAAMPESHPATILKPIAVPVGGLFPYKAANNKYGFRDSKRTIILQPQFDIANEFQENGLARVGIGDISTIQYGFINRMGQDVIPLQYSGASGFSEGLANVNLGQKTGYINSTGKIIIPFIYDNGWSFREGLAAVEQNGKWGFISKTGRTALPFLYNNAESFQEGLALVMINDKYGFINKSGKQVIPPKYMYAYQFYEGLAAVNLDGQKAKYGISGGKWGFIDTAGNVMIPFRYDNAISFSEGLADVSLNGKKGYIDKAGNTVLPFIYTSTGAFKNGRAYVTVSGKGMYIDKTGKETGAYKRVFFSNGDYEGEVAKDGLTPQGKGKMSWLNGTTYEGEFANGLMHGKGKFIQNGSVYEGTFVNGKFTNAGKVSNNISTGNTASVTIPANSTAAVPEPFETIFRNAFNQAPDAAGRGRALATIIDNLHGSAYTEADKTRYISARFKEVYQMDFESAFQGLMKTNPGATTFFMSKVMPTLPPEYKKAINQRARGIVDDYLKKNQKQP
jgi:hypothetical protein